MTPKRREAINLSWFFIFSSVVSLIQLGGVYMIPARLSFRYEFTPVPSCGSVFVYMTPAQNLIME